MSVEPHRQSPRRQPIARGDEEFARVLAFSDGLFAIAMTLLVVGIAVPELSNPDERELWDALADLESAYVSFFISFVVIGRYWIAHHQFFRLLSRLDYGLIWINMIYLAFVAFLPFPTALLGTYFENPVSVAVYAVSIAIVSGLEVLLLRHAHRHRLLERQLPEDVYRWGVLLSSTPVLFFLGSIPIAFASTTVAVLFWFGGIPLQLLVLNRWKPPNADEYIG
ncbi:MAG TPA: TMEM175 family protein [Thermoleophilaceae bacterium]|nr:TMEM175 family protein [Thermoleophilaceae bacterium]